MVKSTDNYGSSNARGTYEKDNNHKKHEGDINN